MMPYESCVEGGRKLFQINVLQSGQFVVFSLKTHKLEKVSEYPERLLQGSITTNL